VNATTERAALLRGVEIYEEMNATVDDRTLEILDRRRRTAVIRRRGWLVRRMLLLADLVGLATAFLIAELATTLTTGPDQVSATTEYLLFLLTLPAWVVVARIYGLYERDEERTDHSTTDDFGGVFHLVTVCAFIFAFGSYLTHVANPTPGKITIFWGAAVVLIPAGRAAARAYCRRHISYLQNTVILGAGDIGQLIAKKLVQHPEYGINLLGFVDDAPKERRDDLEDLTLLGSPDKLPALIRLFDIERVIIAFSNEHHESTLTRIRSLQELNVQVDIVPRFFELLGPNFDIHTVEGTPLVGLPPLNLSRSAQLLKRTLDLAFTVPALLMLAPVFVVIAIFVKRDSGGPILFRQERMGAGDKTFQIFKFRTMAVDADERKGEYAHLNRHSGNGGDPRMFKIENDPRVTRVGRFLRRFSLDELPQLVNVVKGDMSLVGPRPLILDENQHVGDWARRRLDLRPGVTGLWQVLGGSNIPFEEMVKFDYVYVTTWSLWNDFRLLIKTIPRVFRADGSNC
jgi:exopolysaccharide biosynthesis polyprenyl glycosylphosphotransferase